MPETILVVGATGMLGEPVARRLAADGHRVRVMSRSLSKVEGVFKKQLKKKKTATDDGNSNNDRDSDSDSDNNSNSNNNSDDKVDDSDSDDNSNNNITCVEADVDDPGSLQSAMKDCTGIHINLSGGELEAHGTLRVLEAVRRKLQQQQFGNANDNAAISADVDAGDDDDYHRPSSLRRITLISGVTTCEENARWHPGTKSKLTAETRLIEHCRLLGIAYTVFRCTIFLESLPGFFEGRALVVAGDHRPRKAAVRQPEWHWMAADDYARMVSRSYAVPEAANKILFLYGPGPARTIEEAVNGFFVPLCCRGAGASQQQVPTLSVEEARTLARRVDDNEYDDDAIIIISEKSIAKFLWLERIRELGDPSEANELLGKPTITLERWCEEYDKNNTNKNSNNNK